MKEEQCIPRDFAIIVINSSYVSIKSKHSAANIIVILADILHHELVYIQSTLLNAMVKVMMKKGICSVDPQNGSHIFQSYAYKDKSIIGGVGHTYFTQLILFSSVWSYHYI